MFDDLPEYSSAEMFGQFLTKNLPTYIDFIEINTPDYSLFRISLKSILYSKLNKPKIIPKIKRYLAKYNMDSYTENGGLAFNVYLHKSY